uniref:Uncharacterized protein n=1 Tax=Caenorhabditis japonica TaxID=281687 RepID=A0A8R1E6D0_CAEJA
MMCSSIRGDDFGLRDYPVCPGLWDVSKPATSKLGRFEALMLFFAAVFALLNSAKDKIVIESFTGKLGGVAALAFAVRYVVLAAAEMERKR